MILMSLLHARLVSKAGHADLEDIDQKLEHIQHALEEVKYLHTRREVAVTE